MLLQSSFSDCVLRIFVILFVFKTTGLGTFDYFLTLTEFWEFDVRAAV